MKYQIEMAQAEREALKPSEFVFPSERKWPIQDKKQAMTALTWSTWPKHKKVAKEVRQAVFAKYPSLKKKFEGRKQEERTMGVTLGDVMKDRFDSLRELIKDNQPLGKEDIPSLEKEDNDVSESKYSGNINVFVQTLTELEKRSKMAAESGMLLMKKLDNKNVTNVVNDNINLIQKASDIITRSSMNIKMVGGLLSAIAQAEKPGMQKNVEHYVKSVDRIPK